MKKLVLFAAVIALTTSAMAQKLETKAQPATEKSKALKTPAQDAAVKPAPQKDVSQDQGSADNVIKVNTTKYDFGKIKQGTPVTYAFDIKNITEKPVVVENTYASCGCTTPEKIVEPIAPGATAKLKVQYNAANPGTFTKQVHIKLAGVAQEKIVEITGEVVPAEAPKN
jgi:hypothetical protein